jgi:hypothetical protein
VLLSSGSQKCDTIHLSNRDLVFDEFRDWNDVMFSECTVDYVDCLNQCQRKHYIQMNNWPVTEGPVLTSNTLSSCLNKVIAAATTDTNWIGDSKQLEDVTLHYSATFGICNAKMGSSSSLCKEAFYKEVAAWEKDHEE